LYASTSKDKEKIHTNRIRKQHNNDDKKMNKVMNLLVPQNAIHFSGG
jgi:hypothetical protein